MCVCLCRANILGHKGEVAEEFGVIMKALWSGQYKCISPRDFKITIGKINDQFSGYEQQDSQELLLFLMDGLHEDLNKVGTPRGHSGGLVTCLYLVLLYRMYIYLSTVLGQLCYCRTCLK